MGFGAQGPDHAERRRRGSCCATPRRVLRRRPARWSPSCSSCASTGRRCRRSPTPRSGLFHLYVHEPLIARRACRGWDMAEEMEGLAAREIMPLASPIMDHAPQPVSCQHFIEQDVIGHMEADPRRRGFRRPTGVLGRLARSRSGLRRPWPATHAPDRGGRRRRGGEHRRGGSSSRFEISLARRTPRIIKTIGDEVMVVGLGSGPPLLDWGRHLPGAGPPSGPLPRIGIHYGETLLPRRRLLRAARVKPGLARRRAGAAGGRGPGHHGPSSSMRVPGLAFDPRVRRGAAEGLHRGPTELFLGAQRGPAGKRR